MKNRITRQFFLWGLILAFSLPGIVQVVETNWLALVVNQRIFRQSAAIGLALPPDTLQQAIPSDRRARLLGYWLLAEGDYPAAKEILEKGSSRTLGEALLLVFAAATNDRLGLPEVALGQLIQAGAFQQIFQRGQKAAEVGDAERARVYFEAAWKINPANPVLVEAMVRFSEGQADLVQAAEVLQAAIQIHSGVENEGWRVRLGGILEKAKRWPEAEAIYQVTLALFPDNWQAHLGLARCLYYGRHDFASAMAEVNWVIERFPNLGEGYESLGELYSAEKLYDEALASYTRQVELTPDSYWPISNLTQVLSDMGRVQEAIQVLETDGSHFPQEPHRYYQLAYNYHQIGETARAIDAARQAVALDYSHNAGYLITLGIMYEAGGYIDQAVAAYQDALAIDPGQPDALEALRRLQNP
jgi:tetratricopeptide (TPR) repeat protein